MKITEKIKNIWTRHKGKIIIGGMVVGGVVIYTLTRQYGGKSNANAEGLSKLKDFEWVFDDFDEALIKFKEIEGQCVQENKGDFVTLWGGQQQQDKAKYLIQLL